MIRNLPSTLSQGTLDVQYALLTRVQVKTGECKLERTRSDYRRRQWPQGPHVEATRIVVDDLDIWTELTPILHKPGNQALGQWMVIAMFAPEFVHWRALLMW